MYFFLMIFILNTIQIHVKIMFATSDQGTCPCNDVNAFWLPLKINLVYDWVDIQYFFMQTYVVDSRYSQSYLSKMILSTTKIILKLFTLLATITCRRMKKPWSSKSKWRLLSQPTGTVSAVDRMSSLWLQ